MKNNDKLIKEQAIVREYQTAERRKREPKFVQGPGHSVVGSVLDCNREHFERVLTTYWDKLYVGWNPYKNKGAGCWEVWQKPSQKTPKLWGYVRNGDFSTFKGSLNFYDEYTTKAEWEKVYSMEYQPSDFEHWVANLDYLSYDFVAKLRSMDAWENKTLVADHDEAYEEHFRKLKREEDENIKDVVRNNKRAFRDLLDYTQSGYNPLDFFRNIKK